MKPISFLSVCFFILNFLSVAEEITTKPITVQGALINEIKKVLKGNDASLEYVELDSLKIISAISEDTFVSTELTAKNADKNLGEVKLETCFLKTELAKNKICVGSLKAKWQEKGIIYQDEKPKLIAVVDTLYRGIEINREINKADVILALGVGPQIINPSRTTLFYGLKTKYQYEDKTIEAGGILIYGSKEKYENYTGFVSLKGETKTLKMPFLVLLDTEKKRNEQSNLKPFYRIYGELWYPMLNKLNFTGIGEYILDMEKDSAGGKLGIITLYKLFSNFSLQLKGMLDELVLSGKEILIEPRIIWQLKAEKIIGQLYFPVRLLLDKGKIVETGGSQSIIGELVVKF